MLAHILIGILFGYIFWKLLKITFKSIFWILLIGIVAALVFPKLLFLVGGIGLSILSILAVLFILTIAGFFFFNNN